MASYSWLLLGGCVLLASCGGDDCNGGTGNCPQNVTLTIVVSPGVIATPSEAQQVQAGTKITYEFHLSPGYEHLRVTFDSAEVAPAGTLEVQANGTLRGTADLILDPDQDASIVAADQALLTAPNPYAVYLTLEDLTRQLIQQVGLEAAERRLAAARVLAYEPVRDAPALNRALAAVGESLYARNGAALRLAVQTLSDPSTPLVVYVNGIRTQEEGFKETRDRLQSLLDRHGSTLKVDGFYNPTWNRQNPVADAMLCIAMQNDLVKASQWTKRFQAIGNMLLCLTIAPIETISVLDLLKSFSYTLRADQLPTLAIQDLTNRINDIIPSRPLVLVLHSGGNLLAQVALTRVAAGPNRDRLACVGVVGLAPPTIEGWPVQPAGLNQGIIQGRRVGDIMLSLDQFPNFSHSYVEPTQPGLHKWENALSNVLDDEADLYGFSDWELLEAALWLHEVNDSYLAYPETEQHIWDAIQEQATAVIRNCGGSGNPLTVTTSSLPSGVVGATYSAHLTGSGGIGGYTWSVVGGALPSGLTLATNGVVSGVPTQRETADFMVQVESGGNTATRTLSLTIAPAALIFQPPTVAFEGVVGGGDPADQSVTVTSSTSSIVTDLSMTGVSYDGADGWLTATLVPATLNAPASLDLHAHVGSLVEGNYTAIVTVGSASEEGTVPVSLHVQQDGGGGTDVSGKWLYLVAFDAIDAQNRVDCVISTGSHPGEPPDPSEDLDLGLTQTGGTLQGTHPAMSYLCLSLSTLDAWSDILPPGPVTGTISGTTLSFNLTSSNWHNTATYHADQFDPTITGVLTILLDLNGLGQVSISGDYTVHCDFTVTSACNPDTPGIVRGPRLH